MTEAVDLVQLRYLANLAVAKALSPNINRFGMDTLALISEVERLTAERDQARQIALHALSEIDNDEYARQLRKLRRATMPDTPNVYRRFIEELDALTINANDPAARVVGELTRAVKRAQMVVDGELKPLSESDGGLRLIGPFDIQRITSDSKETQQ